ncbi:MAG: hypothetical protein AABX02_05340 [archaeon]
MSYYTVISFTNFEEKYYHSTEKEKQRINRLLDQLSEKGEMVGKPLAGYWFFREKKMNGNRLYFLVYREWKTVLLVDVGHKKIQQKIISEILIQLENHKEYTRKKLLEMKII